MNENMNMKPVCSVQGLSHCCSPAAREEARSSGAEKDPGSIPENQEPGPIRNLCFFFLSGDGDGWSLRGEAILLTDILRRKTMEGVGAMFHSLSFKRFYVEARTHLSSHMF